MTKLISECNHFIKDCGFTYAFCGGYALELFLDKKLRPHSDIDISIFTDNIVDSIEFVLNKGWYLYEPKSDWTNNQKIKSDLRPITSLDEKGLTELSTIWAIKPNCSFIKIEPNPDEKGSYHYEILDGEQKHSDFFEIIFNRQKEGKFIVDPFTSQGKNITRELSKAILSNDEGLPYLAPSLSTKLSISLSLSISSRSSLLSLLLLFLLPILL